MALAERAAEEAQRREVATKHSLGEEIELLRERLTALGDVDLLFQVRCPIAVTVFRVGRHAAGVFVYVSLCLCQVRINKCVCVWFVRCV